MWEGEGDVAGEGGCERRGRCGKGRGCSRRGGDVAGEGECLPIIIALKDRIL